MKLRILATIPLFLTASAFAASAKPLKVFILAGQSNMDGQAGISTIDFLGAGDRCLPITPAGACARD